MNRPKVIVIGLDGATWDLIKPWAENGELPTFKKLMANGSWGILESVIPPVTPPAWVSLATGKNPAKHGIIDFIDLNDANNKSKRIINSNDINSKTIFDILSNSGIKCLIQNYPLTYPVKKINGIMISDWLSGKDNYVYPPELKKYLDSKKYEFSPNVKVTKEDFIGEVTRIVKKQLNLFKEFLDQNIDFGVYVLSLIHI